MLRRVVLDGSAASRQDLLGALAGALDGGPAVLPVEPGQSFPAPGEPDPGPAVVLMTSGSSGEPGVTRII